MCSVSYDLSQCDLHFSVDKMPIKLNMFKAASDILTTQYNYHNYEKDLMKIPFHLGCYKYVQVHIPERSIHISYNIKQNLEGDNIAITL